MSRKAVPLTQRIRPGSEAAPWVCLEINALEARVAELEGALGVCRQFRLEVAHAMECGPGWYTRGENGLRQQIHMWIDRAGKALQALGGDDE